MTKVGVDLGHGRNTFPPSKGFYKNGIAYHEHNFNAILGERLREILEAHDIEVVMAQQPFTNDVPLGERRDIYMQEEVDLVVSLHANWNNNREVNGRCVFYWHSSSNGKKLATLIRDTIKELGYEMHGNGLHASVRHTWTDLYITRALPMTSILAEHGFMNGIRDFDFIFGSKQRKHVEDMALANAKGICAFLGIDFKEELNPVKQPPKRKTYYRVQIGAFKQVGRVAAFANEMERKTGFDTYITEADGLMRVQVGAFKSRSGAEKRLTDVKKHGYNDAFITTESGSAVPETEPRDDHSEEKPHANLVVDGKWGRATTRAWQQYFGLVADGEIWGQYNTAATRSVVDGVVYGPPYNGSPLVRAIQRLVGAKEDGLLGPETIRKLQAYLGTPVDGELWNPSAAIRAVQQRLNDGTL